MDEPENLDLHGLRLADIKHADIWVIEKIPGVRTDVEPQSISSEQFLALTRELTTTNPDVEPLHGLWKASIVLRADLSDGTSVRIVVNPKLTRWASRRVDGGEKVVGEQFLVVLKHARPG